MFDWLPVAVEPSLVALSLQGSITDQLHTLQGFDQLSQDQQRRVLLLAYNQGWTPDFLNNINAYGFEEFIEVAGYDNQTLDAYLRWAK